MDKLQAPCGLICSECESYRATQANDAQAIRRIAREWSDTFGRELDPDYIWCDGCMADSARKCGYVSTCDVRTCAVRRGLESCAHCGDYVCERLEGFFKMAPQVRDNLEAIRNGGA